MIKELKKYKQFCVSKSDDKSPLMPNGKRADVSLPETWSSYEDCAASGYPHIGFVFSEADPFWMADLDDHRMNPRTPKQKVHHRELIKEANTYTEISLSGRGIHIIGRGSLPRNIALEKQLNVSLFNRWKYLILTLNVVGGRDKIKSRNRFINSYFDKISKYQNKRVITDGAETMGDADLVHRILASEQAEKFSRLSSGDISGYPSNSEADSAYMAILCFWTKSNDQAKRIFRMSPIGRRAKAQREDYLNRTIQGVRGLQPQVDIEAIEALLDAPARCPAPATPPPKKQNTTKKRPASPNSTKRRPSFAPSMEPSAAISPSVSGYFPPGIVGRVAAYIYKTSYRPVPEVSLAAATALCAALVGRSHNISSTGLNTYNIVLARTGMGKEEGPHGINRLIAAMSKSNPNVLEDKNGPAHYASGQAILRTLSTKPSILSVVSEFGHVLNTISNPRANSAEQMIVKVLLDVFSKSGINGMLFPNAYSDSTKNTETIVSPNLNILGESTPSKFYSTMTNALVDDGLASRFTVYAYTGKRPPPNDLYAFKKPPQELVSKLLNVYEFSAGCEAQKRALPVPMSGKAKKLLDAFNEYCDDKINATVNDSEVMLFNRAHLKALRMAGVLAACDNPHAPIVTDTIASWCISFVKSEVVTTYKQLTQGVYGNDENARETIVKQTMSDYLNAAVATRRGYQIGKKLAEVENVVPYSFLKRRLCRVKQFTDDRNGALRAINSTLQDMQKTGSIVLIPADLAKKRYSTTIPLYLLKP